jgi:hypothetical protein
MSTPKTGKNQDKNNHNDREQEAREKELLEQIEQVENEQSGNVRPQKESPHDFVERRKRETSKK